MNLRKWMVSLWNKQTAIEFNWLFISKIDYLFQKWEMYWLLQVKQLIVIVLLHEMSVYAYGSDGTQLVANWLEQAY